MLLYNRFAFNKRTYIVVQFESFKVTKYFIGVEA